MKIAVHIPDFSPTVGGGFQFQQCISEGLLRFHPRNQHEIIILTERKTNAAYVESWNRLRVISLRANFFQRLLNRVYRILNWLQDVSPAGRRINFQSSFARCLTRNGVDLVWFTTPNFVECDVPYIYTVLDLQYLLQPWFPEVSAAGEWAKRKSLYESIILRSVFTIVPNHTGKLQLLRFFPIGEDRVLENPHPTPDFALDKAKNLTEQTPKPSRPYVFYPAQYWPHKNHRLVLDAISKLKKDGIKADVVCVGSDRGNLSFLKNEASKLGISDQVDLRGFVSQEELRSLYEGAVATTYVSLFGPENLPPLEAFAIGCPVIASDIPGAREQLRECAIFIDPYDSDALASAIHALMQSETKRDELIQKGKRRALEWKSDNYINKVFEWIDDFEKVRRLWGRT